MAIVMGDLRTALVANKAATELATYEARLDNVETRLSVPTWMVGANIALSMATLFRVFR